jgi:hypothetical protein
MMFRTSFDEGIEGGGGEESCCCWAGVMHGKKDSKPGRHGKSDDRV